MASVFSLTHGRGQTRAQDLPPIENKRWAVFGMGATGRAVASLLMAHGALLRLVDGNPSVKASLQDLFADAELAIGPVTVASFAACDAVFVSQGVPPQLPVLEELVRLGIPLVGELELLQRFAPGATIAGVTGTNGKSTTTALLGELIRHKRPDAFVGGNLGTPVATWLLQGAEDGLGVVELSSSLVDGMLSVTPKVAVVLNVTPDHLERYGDMAAYAASKARLVEALDARGTAILNADDDIVRVMATRCAGTVWWFGQTPLPGDGLRYFEDDTFEGQGALRDRWPRQPMAHARLLGRHNRDNAMAALLAADALLAPRLPPSQEWMAIYQRFSGLPHRLQLVGTYRGARWLNDSKATNDASAATAIRAVFGPIVLLLGGYDKGGGYREVIEALRAKPAKAVLVFGGARDVIASALREAGLACELFETLAAACTRAERLVTVGDAVLLSPACSSFDAFLNYVHRGEWFMAWVQGKEAEGDPIA